ncbi:MAG: hypothetical protein HZC28_20140 [Spirochaetes bacterium]|nr:hypothetical protein [Spirochaetota bacterium]
MDTRLRTAVFAVVCAALMAIISCNDAERTVLSSPVRALSNYTFSPASSLQERVVPAPQFMLSYLRAMDQRSDYSNHVFTAEEQRTVNDAIALLPSAVSSIMRERLVAFYFVDNFLGGGMADWLFDGRSNVYCFLIFNPATLTQSVSSWLTMKDSSCFIPDGTNRVVVNCGERYRAFLYILLHEGTHAADYAGEITPYTERTLFTLQRRTVSAKPFTDRVWASYNVPERKYDFPLRTNITVYGFGGGPKIAMRDAAALYRSLMQTPFVSLYAATSWAEDLADNTALRYMTETLRIPYVISVVSNKIDSVTVRPAEHALVRHRTNRLIPGEGKKQ